MTITLVKAPVIEHGGLTGMGDLVDKRIKSLKIEDLVATSQSVKSLKEIRTKLNKEFKGYEEQRKTIKQGVSNPYLVFENSYKINIAEKYKAADILLKSKILSVEDELKLEREEELKGFFIETCMAKEVDFLTFNQVGLNITLSASMKSLKEKITAFVDEAEKNLLLIDTLDESDNYRVDVSVEFKKSLDLPAAIKAVKARNEQKEIERQKRDIAEVKAATPKPEPIPEPEKPLQAPTVEQPEEIFEMKFATKGTLTQLKALKAFMIDAGIEFKSL